MLLDDDVQHWLGRIADGASDADLAVDLLDDLLITYSQADVEALVALLRAVRLSGRTC